MKAQMVLQAKESQEREIALKNLYLEVSRLKADKAATVAAAESERAKIAERRAEVAAAAAVAAVKAAELAAAARVIAAAAAEEQRIKDVEIALKKKEDDAKKEEELMIKQIEENMKREEEVYARMKEEKKRDAEAKDKKARILEAKRIKLLKINKNENITPIRNKERENGMTPDSSGGKSQVLINGEMIGDENERYERRNGDSAGVGVSGSKSVERGERGGGEGNSIENTAYQTNSNSNSISKSYSSTPQGMQEDDGRSLSSFRSPYSSYGMGYKDQETTPRANTSTNTDGEAFSERYVRTSYF
jgi:hypothetical protein